MSQFLPVCNDNTWSDEYTSKMIVKYDTEEQLTQIVMEMLEIATVVDYGKCLSKFYYIIWENLLCLNGWKQL